MDKNTKSRYLEKRKGREQEIISEQSKRTESARTGKCQNEDCIFSYQKLLAKCIDSTKFIPHKKHLDQKIILGKMAVANKHNSKPRTVFPSRSSIEQKPKFRWCSFFNYIFCVLRTVHRKYLLVHHVHIDFQAQRCI